jgi:uncharacterized protein (TIGR03435 family)
MLRRLDTEMAMSARFSLCIVATVLLVAAASTAQITFEVASVRENTQPGGPSGLRRSPDGAVRAERMRARFLITIAYGLQPFQLVNTPAWSNDAYYDINAKPAPGSATSREQMADMLQALLAERFKLAFHREVRLVDGFALVRVRPGALGPELKVSAIDCDKTPALRACAQTMGAPNALSASGAPMYVLIQQLIAAVNAPVEDETGLSGTYDINLRWSNDASPTDDLPSLFTAIQEQLGLRLERRRVNAAMFVVDRLERPAPD